MNKKFLLVLAALFCLAVLGMALYMQTAHSMFPCPSCILQRYAFIGVLIFALLGALFNAPRLLALPALGCALAGAGVAIKQLHALASPDLSCGFDPLAGQLNALPTAQVWPQMFEAVGLCTTPYPPFLGLSFPMWSLLSFIALVLVMGWVVLSRKHS